MPYRPLLSADWQQRAMWALTAMAALRGGDWRRRRRQQRQQQQRRRLPRPVGKRMAGKRMGQEWQSAYPTWQEGKGSRAVEWEVLQGRMGR